LDEFDSLSQLPDSWWTERPNPDTGYVLKCKTRILGVDVVTLNDTGAACNGINEEFLVGMMKLAARKGISPKDARYPVVALERWPDPEYVVGISRTDPVPIIGSAIIRVEFPDMQKPGKNGPTAQIRVKIFPNNLTTFQGLLLGAPALEPTWLGGLGFQPCWDCFYYEALDVSCARMDDPGRYKRQPEVFAMQFVRASCWRQHRWG